MKRVLLSVFAPLVVTAPAHASVSPVPGQQDPHIQSVQYDTQQVVSLKVAAGYALTLEFGPDERVETVALGNSSAWQVTPNKQADHLFIKPTQMGLPTNMTVVTGQRTYAFELTALPTPNADMAYVVRFSYPAPTEAFAATQDSLTGYGFRGAKVLKPAQMSDDGKVTTITWPAGMAAPAVYAVESDGHESLVSAAQRDDRYIIERIADAYVFRLGNLQARAVRRPHRSNP